MNLPRNAQLWWKGLRESEARVRRHHFDGNRPVTVHVMVGDHYEPRWHRGADDVAQARVAVWRKAWPQIAERARDSNDRPAQWTFFYPQEEYAPELIEPLAEMARAGHGDVEVHIHHDGEGERNFVERMQGFIDALRNNHGLLHDVDGRPAFGFIHGNWALDNSRPDGRWCGLNNELTLLRALNCYADFTMPAAPDPCQTTLVNAIYWAVDDPQRPKSHDNGPLVTVGVESPADALLCVQGPLALRAHPRWRVIPTLEVGELAGYAPPAPIRARRWLDVAPRIGNSVFVKLFAHGAPEKNAGPMLNGFIERTFADIRHEASRRNWRLSYVTAWEMAQAIERARVNG